MDWNLVFEIISALGSIATALTFIYVVKGQRGTQKQIDSLSRMADVLKRDYEMQRIQAGVKLYPQLRIEVRGDGLYGIKFLIKNNAYPIQIYRIILKRDRDYLDIQLPFEQYITIRQGETKPVIPGEYSRSPTYLWQTTVRFFLITPFEEAYEIRYVYTDPNNQYQSEAIPILYSEEQHKPSKNKSVVVESRSIHGEYPGTIDDNFPEVNKEFENEL